MFMPAPSKEGFNALSELLGAVQSQAYREACQAITGQSNPATLGLAPDPQDARLYYAYPVAVRMLIERVGELRRTMNDEFARLGELRLKAALADGDREGMVSVALQFVGTPAAAEARRWLGDQAVSSGHFDEAVGHYRHAMRDAAAEARSPLAARIRLAEAFRGAEAGSPVGAAVQLGALELPAARFEQLVGETRKARADEGLIAASSQSSPPRGDYTARSIGRLDGTSKPDRGASPGIDWGARQMAAGYSSRSLLLSDIASMAAWQIDDGKELWKQGLREGDKNRLPLTAVRPAVAADRVFVRRTMREKADLACFSLNDGQPLWSVLPDDAVVSDPLVSGQNVFVFTVRKSFPQKLVLSLCRLTADSGDTVIVQPVAELLDMWKGELPCQAALIDDMLVATAGGAVLCCHQDGTVQWVRQQVWMPSRDAEQQSRPWFSGQHEPPLTFDDRVLAFQPGMKGLECLDLLSGQLVWQRTLPQIDRVVGVVADRVVVRAGYELIGLEATTGAVAWRHATADVAEALLCGPSGVVYVKREEHKDDKAPRRPVMVWLDAKNGQAMGESPVEGISQSKPLFGPLLAAGDRAWLVVATEDKPQERTLWELKRR
jgi:outer membrane protein assembly factor BamB